MNGVIIRAGVEHDTRAVQLAVAVRPMVEPSVTASAAGGERVALDAREAANLITDTLAVSHARAVAILRHVVESAQQLAELTREAGR